MKKKGRVPTGTRPGSSRYMNRDRRYSSVRAPRRVLSASFAKKASISSGVAGNPGQANYAAGKMGVVGLTKTLAKEWGRFNINVKDRKSVV